MGPTVIRAQALSKEYRLGGNSSVYCTLRDSIASSCRNVFRGKRRVANTFRALDDVGFEVAHGDVVGLIGRNGAGKSTLLKILSRITRPSAGFAEIHGRVGSLLEVGTGFHGELTGRENIFLNGAILGMKRAEIRQQFDSIVEFAEVKKFIDTPVKFYSSGMYLRLAFAVAAHLKPQILLVDEVLAVGDIAFQKKCLGKMGDVAREGRTVIFVSHNMAAVRALCQKGIVLEQGRIFHSGDIGSSIEAYYRLCTLAQQESEQQEERTGFGRVQLFSHNSNTIQQEDGFEVGTTLNFHTEAAGFSLIFILQDSQQRNVLHHRRDSPDLKSQSRWTGRYKIRLKLPPLWLEPGLYSMHFKAILWNCQDGARILSDSVYLDVGGEACGWGAILSPHAQLSMEPEQVNSLI